MLTEDLLLLQAMLDCGDGIDNDGDDAIDTEDPDCGSTPPPPPSGELDCGDGIDNDGDDAIDAEDPDCGGQPPNPRERYCSDGIDNDGDGKVDDLNECESSCSDDVDNDGDGKIDTGDNDCQPGGPCPLCLPGQPATTPVIDSPPSTSPRPTGSDSQRPLLTAPQLKARKLFQMFLLEQKAALPREDNCSDGIDNNHNGLKDSEDPSLRSAGNILYSTE